MAVQKIVVIALVAVIAVPILLGYALNLEQTTHSEYKIDKDDTPVNVSPLLWNSTVYNYAHADITQLNTNLIWAHNIHSIPIYNKISSQKSTYPLTIAKYTNQSWNGADQGLNFSYFYEQWDYNPGLSQHSIDVYKWSGGTQVFVQTLTNIHSFYYDKIAQKYEYTRYVGVTSFTTGSGTGDLSKLLLWSANGTCDVYVASSSSSYADLSAGFYFQGQYNSFAALTDGTKNVLMTVNLDSITAANYSTILVIPGATNYHLQKTTGGSGVTWKVVSVSDPTDITELYYDPGRNDNTYQIFLEINKTGQHTVTVGGTTALINDYTRHMEFRYVGGWPTLIGEAPYYLTFDFDDDFVRSDSLGEAYVSSIGFTDTSSTTGRSPTFRIDDAIFGAFENQIIKDQTYDPATFKTNPSTTIKNVSIYGLSITFGGNTYAVKNGNITLGTHEIPVKDLVLSSTPISGGYENKIGNTVVSTTVTPSTITFDGGWKMDVISSSMIESSYTTTEWTPGQFAWDGIDQNFLIVGLITCLGVFVGLGIYARKRGSGGIIPLMIVTGCAATVFFIML